jgi:hypothetical protein
MKENKIGRNEPCPCGSGKKYKKCCLTISKFGDSFTNHFIPAYNAIDFGSPKLTDMFFKLNKIRQGSAPLFLYNLLFLPEFENKASKVLNNYISRSEDEKSKIIKCNKPEDLLAIALSNPDTINQILLIEKMLEYKEKTMPLILKELKTTSDDLFVDIAIKILHRSKVDISNELIRLIHHHQKIAYIVSQLCMLLGFYNNPQIIKTLWDYYHYFRENFNEETYSDGPLIGLIENTGREIQIQDY